MMFISTYSDSLDDANEVSKWLISQVEGDHIEDVTDEMLDKLVSGDNPGVSSTFCKYRFFMLISVHGCDTLTLCTNIKHRCVN